MKWVRIEDELPNYKRDDVCVSFCEGMDIENIKDIKLSWVIDTFRRLVDLQNGCPLESYRDEWEKAMLDAETLLRQLEGVSNE